MAMTGFSHWTDGNKCSELVITEAEIGVLKVGSTGAQFVCLTTAITANTTTTTLPVGSLATTTNATGLGKLFISDGSKWQYPVVV